MHRFELVGLGIVLAVAGGAWWAPAPDLTVAAGLVACAGLLLRRLVRMWELVLGLALGTLIVTSLAPGPWLRGECALVGQVVSSPVGRTADVAVSRAVKSGEAWEPQQGRVRVRFPGSAPPPGTPVILWGLAGPVQQSGLPGSPDAVRAARLARIRTAVAARGFRVLGGDPPEPAREVPGLLRAIALGDRSDVDPEMLSLMRTTGTAHLLAVSGSNVALAAGAGVLIARSLVGAVAWRQPAGRAPWIVPATAVWAATAFTVLVGLPTSAQRALVGVLLVAVASATGRHVRPLGIVGWCAALLLVADPSSVASASFHLSFGAVLGLATWGRALDALVPEAWPGWASGPLRLLLASVAATIGTLPASAWWFQSLPPLGPVANLFAVPWATFVLTPCAFGALLLPEPLAAVAVTVGTWATEVQRQVLRPLALPPFHPAVGPVGAALLCGVLLLHQRPTWALVWVMGVLGWPSPRPTDLRLTFFDVGQGDSTLIQWPDGRDWLVDGGVRWTDLPPGLRRMGITHLDRVVATHGDLDHVGGLPRVLEELSVRELHLAGHDGLEELRALAEAAGIPVIDDEDLRLWPGADLRGERNAVAIVSLVESARGRALLPADVDAGVERVLAPLLPPVDVLKLGHHGSRTSSSAELLDALCPTLAVVSCGRDNDYGHPHASVVRRVVDAGATILRTDLHGTVQVELGEEVRWRAHRFGEGWTPWINVPRRSCAAATEEAFP